MYVEGVSPEFKEAEKELIKYLDELYKFIQQLPPKTDNIQENIEKRIDPLRVKINELDRKYPKAAILIHRIMLSFTV